MPRGLTDQMEPPPPHVQEMRAALAVYRRAADEWKARAEKAETEVARLRDELDRIATDGDLYSSRIASAALADSKSRTFVAGRALNTPFDVPPDESLKPREDDGG